MSCRECRLISHHLKIVRRSINFKINSIYGKITLMFTKSVYFFLTITFVLLVLLVQSLYIYLNNSVSQEEIKKKQYFVQTTGLPDLSLSTDASYIRHRSLSHISTILNEDGTLREYFPSTFSYSVTQGNK